MTATTTKIPVPEAFGQHVRAKREQRQISQRQLAQDAGVGLRTLIDVEQGRVACRLDTAAAIAGALGVSLGELVDT